MTGDGIVKSKRKSKAQLGTDAHDGPEVASIVSATLGKPPQTGPPSPPPFTRAEPVIIGQGISGSGILKLKSKSQSKSSSKAQSLAELPTLQ
jgi:hypothetical protein